MSEEDRLYSSSFACLQTLVALSREQGEDVGEVKSLARLEKELELHVGTLCLHVRKEATTQAVRIKAIPVLLSTLQRVLGRGVSIGACQISSPTLILAGLDCLSVYMESFDSSCQTIQALAACTSSSEKETKTLERLLLILLCILEALKAHLSPDEGKTRLVADKETMCINCLTAFKCILVVWGGVCNVSTNEPFLAGPYLAQAVQNFLFFSKHKSKQLAQLAVTSLAVAIERIQLRSEWRTYFPGIFSSLYSICMAGQKRGTEVQCATLCCLLRLTCVVASDQADENECILAHLAHSSSSLFSQPSGDMLPQEQIVAYVLGSIRSKSDQHRGLQQDASQSMEKRPPRGYDTMQDFLKWRVDLLQRIRTHLPSAFDEVYKACSIKQREVLLVALGDLLLKSRQFLGHACFGEFLALLMRGTSDDTAPSIRQTARSIWAQIKEKLIISGDWANTSSHLMERFVHGIQGLSSLLGGGNDARLLQSVLMLLGCGQAIRTDLRLAFRVSGGDLLKKVAQSFCPDLEGCRARVLESRNYAFNGARTVIGAYYRVPWAYTRDEHCKRSLRKLCVLMGKGGVSRLLMEIVSSCERTVEVSDEHGLIVNRAVTKAQIFQEAVGAWNALCNALLGLVGDQVAAVDKSVSKATSLGATKYPCALCGVMGPPNRCTRCMCVSYCSQAHQSEHWKIHKKTCIQREEESAIVTNHNVETQDEVKQDDEDRDDVVDPEKLLSCEHLCCPFVSSDDSFKRTDQSQVRDDERIVNSIVRLAVSTIKHHLYKISIVTQEVERGGQDGLTVCTLRGLLLASAAETIANCGLLLGVSFRPLLIDCLYPLLELHVCCDITASQAALASLDRLAVYLLYEQGTAQLLSENLDYVVDEACSRLKPFHGSAVRRNGSEMEHTHLVIDLVFTKLESSLGGHEPRLTALLKSLLLDAFSSMDTLASAGNLSHEKAAPLLRMMHVLVCKAANAVPTLPPHNADASRDDETTSGLLVARKSLAKFNKEMQTLRGGHDEDDEDVESDEDDNEARETRLTKAIQKMALSKKKDEEEVAAEDLEEEESKSTTPTPSAQLIKDVLQRCCYFISLHELRDQVAVLEIMHAAFLRLAIDRYTFLPTIHQSWPAIMSRFLEQSSILIAHHSSTTSAMSDTSIAIAPKAAHQLRPRLVEASSSIHISHSSLLNGGAKLTTAPSPLFVLPTPPEQVKRRKAMLLPPLLDLITLLAGLSKDFFSIKFQDDLWPQLVVILKCIAKVPEEQKSSSIGATFPSGQSLSRSDLVVVCDKSKRAGTVEGDRGMEMQAAIDATMPLPRKSHSLDEKLKKALLACLRQFATLPDCEPYVRPIAGVCAWHILPLALSGQGETICDLACLTLSDLLPLDAPFVSAILQAILGKDLLATKKVQEELWTSIACDPRITRSYGKNIVTAPPSKTLFEAFKRDLSLASRLERVLSKANSVPLFGSAWKLNLNRFASTH